jgi:uncharacterized protein YbaR (Trm112 family)
MDCRERSPGVAIQTFAMFGTLAEFAMTDTPPDRPAGSVDPKLLEILVCPVTKGPLEYDSARQELVSRSAKLAYPIRDGIPIMLPEEARRLD